jgi:hypothetical protein
MSANQMRAIIDWLINIYISVPDLQVKSTLRIGADPSFILNGSTLTAEIR